MAKFLFQFFFFFSTLCSAQVLVEGRVDTLSMYIGEQLNYALEVQMDSLANVQFPNTQTFLPFEIIDTSAVDTSRLGSKIKLKRHYALIQFDSGSYHLPRQRVFVDGILHQTDSILVQVFNVEVDTLKQPLYHIKPILSLEKNTIGWWKPYAGGLVTILALLISYILFSKTREKIRKRKEDLPPFERAIHALQALEGNTLDNQEQYKSYYSELTAIIRNYLEDDAHVDALESTSDELILKLEMLRDAEKLNLEKHTIENLKRVLQTADLVKFARAIPGSGPALSDRNAIKVVVKETKDALPEPDEEELRKTEEYQQLLRKQRRIKQIKITVFSLIGIVILAFILSVSRYGFTKVKDQILGHETLALLHDHWITSSYGAIPITLKSPDVLERKDLLNPNIQEFSSGTLDEGFRIVVYTEQIPVGTDQTFDVQERVARIISDFEAQGAKNLLQRQEEYTTVSGVKGIKISGSFDWGSEIDYIRKEYTILNFTENNGFQQLQMIHDRNDDYATEVKDIISSSITFKSNVN